MHAPHTRKGRDTHSQSSCLLLSPCAHPAFDTPPEKWRWSVTGLLMLWPETSAWMGLKQLVTRHKNNFMIQMYTVPHFESQPKWNHIICLLVLCFLFLQLDLLIFLLKVIGQIKMVGSRPQAMTQEPTMHTTQKHLKNIFISLPTIEIMSCVFFNCHGLGAMTCSDVLNTSGRVKIHPTPLENLTR